MTASDNKEKARALEFGPGPKLGLFRGHDGRIHKLPDGWAHLPPGDAALTRRLKAATETWTLKVKKGRRMISMGLWAEAKTIDRIRQELEAERLTGTYQKRLESSRQRAAKKQDAYVEDFRAAILTFLDFPLQYQELAERMALAVTEHATPVGSGTVARTKRIPLADRARAAVIAWMRHATTSYDSMQIGRVKGLRRELRRELAGQSMELLRDYRENRAPLPEHCPIKRALDES